MGNDNQIQKAGDNSQQLIVGNMNITAGITEQRAREIFAEMNAVARRDYTQDAYELAFKRVNMFEELLMNKIEKVDGMLEAFADPSFQFLLQSAQKTAACTERETDYEMLSELLAHRVEKKEDMKTKASITKAVEIIDQIDDDALCALTMVYAVNLFLPTSGSITEGLNVLNQLFAKLRYMNFPQGIEWMEHLDMLNAIRISSVKNFKKMEEIYPQSLLGYSCVGIEKYSENHDKAIEILDSAQLPQELLVEHELLPEYVRLNFANRDRMLGTKIQRVFQDGTVVLVKEINRQEEFALNSIWDLYSKDSDKIKMAKDAFMQKFDEHETLKELRTWWNELPIGFSITLIGKVLAHANAQRCEQTLPDLN